MSTNGHTIININGSSIQLSTTCSRIYLIKFYDCDVDKTVFELDKIAEEQNFTKIIAKIPSTAKDIFLNNGYKIEVHIQGLYNNEVDGYFVSKFLTKERETCLDKELIEDVLKVSFKKANTVQKCKLKKEFTFKKIEESEIEQLTNLYKKVFISYPFPIFDPDYIREEMRLENDYFGIWKDNELVAADTAEKNTSAQYAEITDFGILPEYRGKNLSICLLDEIENVLKSQNFKTIYTMARASSYGMNVAFARMKYIFVGTLINNTCMNGSLENIHVWYKKIN